MNARENGGFKQHLFRNLLGTGVILGGIVGWNLSCESDTQFFCTIMGVFGGLFIGFLCALFMSDQDS